MTRAGELAQRKAEPRVLALAGHQARGAVGGRDAEHEQHQRSPRRAAGSPTAARRGGAPAGALTSPPPRRGNVAPRSS